MDVRDESACVVVEEERLIEERPTVEGIRGSAALSYLIRCDSNLMHVESRVSAVNKEFCDAIGGTKSNTMAYTIVLTTTFGGKVETPEHDSELS